MATRSIIGYIDNNDTFRGTYVHYDGYPENAVPETEKRLAEVGYAGFVQWVELGRFYGGYAGYDENTPKDTDGPAQEIDWKLTDEEYGYVVYADETVKLAHPAR